MRDLAYNTPWIWYRVGKCIHSAVLREGCKIRRIESIRLDSSRLVVLKLDSTYWKSSDEILSDCTVLW